ncbi:MAG: hypothetical protein RLZZ157_153, partial [Pseudomonadota bacterium]
MLSKKLTAIALVATFGVTACTTIDPNTGEKVPNKAATGAILGALGGAIAGTA